MRLLLPVLLLAGFLVGCDVAPAPAPAPNPALAAVGSVDPVKVTIPALAVSSQLLHLGVDDRRRPMVPPVDQPDVAAWSTWSPRPGDTGPATIIGHVSGTAGAGGPHVPGVFSQLGDLQPGDEVLVWRGDDARLRFRVTRTEHYPKTDLPDRVWAATDGPELRLVTCSGRYDPAGRRFLDQTIVYAELTR